MTHYDVTVTRDGKWWMVRIPEIDGLTQARRLAEVATMAREYVAVTTGVDLADVDVTVHVASVAGVDVDTRLAEIEAERVRAKEIERHAAEEVAELARTLAREIPLRDVGVILGVSHQRVHQLVSHHSEPARAS